MYCFLSEQRVTFWKWGSQESCQDGREDESSGGKKVWWGEKTGGGRQERGMESQNSWRWKGSKWQEEETAEKTSVLGSLLCLWCPNNIIYLHCYCCYFCYCFRCCWHSFSPKDGYFMTFCFLSLKPNNAKWCNVNSTKKKREGGESRWGGGANDETEARHTPQTCCVWRV